jgi:hypothetical protein
MAAAVWSGRAGPRAERDQEPVAVLAQVDGMAAVGQQRGKRAHLGMEARQ